MCHNAAIDDDTMTAIASVSFEQLLLPQLVSWDNYCCHFPCHEATIAAMADAIISCATKQLLIIMMFHEAAIAASLCHLSSYCCHSMCHGAAIAAVSSTTMQLLLPCVMM
jgi:hypothetical protein